MPSKILTGDLSKAEAQAKRDMENLIRKHGRALVEQHSPKAALDRRPDVKAVRAVLRFFSGGRLGNP